MGAAGDMLTAALFDLMTEEQQQTFLRTMNELGIPGLAVRASRSARCGIMGTHLTVTLHGEEEKVDSPAIVHVGPEDEAENALAAEGSAHAHAHDHADGCEEHCGHGHGHASGSPEDCDHGHASGSPGAHDHSHHHHEHATPDRVEELIRGLQVSGAVKAHACAIYADIAEAEAQAHGCAVTEVHFHEVGAMDAVADVTGAALAFELLAPEQILASPVNTGSGTVRCAHGILPVPAPATAHLLRGIPNYAAYEACELCTPTGAAILRHFVSRFGPRPLMVTDRIGIGIGTREFAEHANLVRAFLGEAE